MPREEARGYKSGGGATGMMGKDMIEERMDGGGPYPCTEPLYGTYRDHCSI